MTIEKPECLTDDHLTYLDELRESGLTNMFGAQPYLTEQFPELTPAQAAAVLRFWMETFHQRHRQE